MGLVERKRSGNIFDGSLLNVPGQGILTSKPGNNKNITKKTPVVINRGGMPPTPTPSITPTSTVTPTPSVTPTITPTPSVTTTPTPTPTPTCGRPVGLNEYLFGFASNGVVFINSLSGACNALSGDVGSYLVQSMSVDIGETVYLYRETSCVTLPTGYYIYNNGVVHVVDGIINDFPLCT